MKPSQTFDPTLHEEGSPAAQGRCSWHAREQAGKPSPEECAGERGQVVRTLLGRGCPALTGGSWDESPDAPPADLEDQDRHRRAYGRFTRNFVVQGTGAEWALCWIADLRNRLWGLGGAGSLVDRPHLVFFLHDEVVVHAPAHLADAVSAEVTAAAATAGSLLFRELAVDFPLNVSVVRSYAEAGKPGASFARGAQAP